MKKEQKEENRITLLKLSLYLISLWILLFMLIVLKLDVTNLPKKFAWNSIVILLKYNAVPGICIVLIIIGIIGYILFVDSLKNAKDLPVNIIECESINYENLSFLATYIIPLVCFPMNTDRQIFVMFAVIIVVGCIFVKTNMYYTNPSLVLVGFNVYKVKTNSKTTLKTGIVIIRGEIGVGDSIKYFHLSDNVYFGRRLKNESK